MPIRASSLTAQGLVALLALFAGLCTIFALIATVTDAWNEHQQQTWPEATATLERCSVDKHILPNATRAPVWRIYCRIAYSVGSDQIETTIRSRSTRAGWGGATEQMHQWVAEHCSGTSIAIHYDPQKPATAILTATDMPYAGPRTPSNLKLLVIAFSAFLAFSLLARYLRPSAGAITSDANIYPISN
jgi:Protein of unknown function (DUF3592)